MQNIAKQLNKLVAGNSFTDLQMMPGANYAMVMLQSTYALDIGELANGKLVSESWHLNYTDLLSSTDKKYIEAKETLTASDLTALAFAAFDMMFYDTSIKFLIYATMMLGNYQIYSNVKNIYYTHTK